MKKCPTCNSTRYEKINGDFKCARCGFINKSMENLKEQIDSSPVSPLF
jgi:rubredoxin